MLASTLSRRPAPRRLSVCMELTSSLARTYVDTIGSINVFDADMANVPMLRS